MKIRGKILVLFSIIIVVFFAISVPYVYFQFVHIRENTFENTVETMKMELQNALSAKDDVWLTNALQLANNPIISEAMYEGDRQTCIDVLNRYSSLFAENTSFNNVQVHLIDKELTSFVKSWTADEYGESLEYSSAYQHVIRTRQPLVTPEQSPKGMRLKGLYPVSYNDQVVGIVNFEGGLNSIKRLLETNHIEFLYFLETLD